MGTGLGLARRSGNWFERVALPGTDKVFGRSALASDSSGRIFVGTDRGLAMARAPAGRFEPAAAGLGAATTVYVDPHDQAWFGCGTALCRLKGERVRGVWKGGGGSARPLGRASVRPAGEPVGAQRKTAAAAGCGHGTFYRSKHGADGRERHAGGAQPGRSRPATLRQLPRPVRQKAGWELIRPQVGLTSDDISFIQRDREGSVWVGLLGSGLARWLGYGEWKSWTETDGLLRNSVWAIVRDEAGTLWVGTQMGLNYAQMGGARGEECIRWKPFGGLPMKLVRTLAKGGDGSVWVGGDPGGLCRVEGRTRRVRCFGASDGLPTDAILHLRVDRENRLWVSSRTGLFRLRPGRARVAVRESGTAGNRCDGDFLQRARRSEGRHLGRGQPRTGAPRGRGVASFHNPRRLIEVIRWRTWPRTARARSGWATGRRMGSPG